MDRAGDHAQWQQQQQQLGDQQEQQQFTAEMAGISDDDFVRYLEVDNIDFGFSVFDDNGINGPNNGSTDSPRKQQHLESQHHQHNLQNLDTRATSGYGLDTNFSPQQRYRGYVDGVSASHVSPAGPNGSQRKVLATPMTFATQTSYQHGQAQQQQQQQQQDFNMMQQQQQTFSIPPTPNSTEMYPGAAPYVQHFPEQHGHKQLTNIYGNQNQINGDSFTPMISPDVMPGDVSLQNVPQYTVPGAYLSPLTSPAINPQVHAQQSYSQTHTAESSLQGSPVLGIDFNISASQSNSAHNETSERPKKTRRRGPTGRTSTATIPPGVVPATSGGARSRAPTGAQKKGRENSFRLNSPADELSAAQLPTAPGSATSQSASGRSTAPNTREGTRSKSVSPHALPEARMPPPPKPSSAINDGTSTKKGRSGPSNTLPPATPASLMRLQQRQAKPGQNALSATLTDPSALSPTTGALGMSFEELKLPDAAAVAIPASPIAPLIAKSIAPQSTSTSAVSSPTASGIRSPAVADDATSKKSSGSNVRSSRKRNSTSSNLVSPALRPKISPSIKPLLPERANGISDETHALLLASKSNYQNILEGNHLPGVTYSSELSTNLTSKRTSHKIAEQGRRNRINMAIQEMQSLLPASSLSSTASSSSDKDCNNTVAVAGGDEAINSKGKTTCPSASTPQNGANVSSSAAQGNSKAATVESAIEYIKTLKDNLQERDDQNEALKKELCALRTKLGLSDGSVGDNEIDKGQKAITGAGAGKNESLNDRVLPGGKESNKGEEEGEDATMSG